VLAAAVAQYQVATGLPIGWAPTNYPPLTLIGDFVWGGGGPAGINMSVAVRLSLFL
jgi:hypothetical protein